MTPRDKFKVLLYFTIVILFISLYAFYLNRGNLICLLYVSLSKFVVDWAINSSDPRY